MPRTIAIGDIHGCAVALSRLLQEVAPQKSDTIVGIGDYVDRGLDSNGVIEILIGLVSECHLVPLIGNHELMMFTGLRNRQDFDFWVHHGGSQTLASYGGKTENIPQHHMTFLSHCLKFYETDSHLFVHANYVPEIPLEQQPDQIIFWEHVTDQVPQPRQIHPLRQPERLPRRSCRCDVFHRMACEIPIEEWMFDRAGADGIVKEKRRSTSP